MKKLMALALTVFLLATGQAFAGQAIEYKDGDTVLEGYFARTKAHAPAPVVLIIHQWKGLGEYEKRRADMLAEMGYNAFAIDMYGKGIHPKTNEEAGKLAGEYKADPKKSVQRINAALNLVRSMSSIGPQIAVIGYCFGGTMALELARSGATVDGIVTFHGGLATPDPVTKPGIIKPSIQVQTGADDPHVKPEEVKAFTDEMNTAGADWVLVTHSHAVHSFTEKEAGTDNAKGAAYNAKADQRSWAYALDFLKTVLRP